MIQDTIIPLTDDTRLDLLIERMQASMLRAKLHMTEEAWEAHYEDWAALHEELMRQLRETENRVTAKCLGLAKGSVEYADT